MSTLSQLDIAAVRLVLAVVEAGSISAGAARCHVSVAAASKRISDLEARLGIQLLVRRSRGVRPTPAGEAFVAHARRMAQVAGVMEEDLRDYANGIEDRVRMVANSSAIVQFLPEDLAHYLAVHPGVRIDLEEQPSRAIAETLQTDRADLGLFEANQVPPGIEWAPYRSDTLVCVTHASHPLAQTRGPTAFAETLHYDHVGLYRGTAVLARMERAADEAGRPLRLRIQVTNFDAVCRMVGSGIGIGVVPERIAQDHVTLGRVRSVPLSDAWAARRLILGWPRPRPPSSGAQSLIAHLAAAGQADGA
ncbi:LysR family transcriptional regulator [Achromobacter sp. GG226]|uniref:LysR family transcriptional regulator n=1 Tax=Verticiella alkaliphila TaxID=2779529 RepID=UPI001C0CA145|nr:LysR family transcriptional regulator [Verticiella sp. GG226]MBU4610919.1 LysR family transcriptional regulator [Verticiella sp. GG226]